MQPTEPLSLVPLAGSERPAGRFAASTSGVASPTESVEATVVLRRRAPLPPEQLSGPGLSADEFAAAYGADPGDVSRASERFTDLGLRVLDVDAPSRRLRLRGDVATMERVFGTSLSSAVTARQAHRVRTGGLSIPADLDGIVTAVLGLDDRPQSRSRYRISPHQAVSVSYTPVELATIYDFPTDVDGSGQTVAIIELGGGFAQSDLDTYFSGLGVQSPRVTAVGVDGAANVAGADPSGADGEVLLDIEVVGAMAPGADVVVYFAPNTDAGFLDAVSQAAHATPTPTAISISWGQEEDAWTQQARTAMDNAFADAAALGATVTCAAGDDGSTDRASDKQVHVDFPAASPHALACGGTRLTADPKTGTVSAETVWNNGPGNGATGGGYSVTFPRPAYQQGLPPGNDGAVSAVPIGSGRGVPDVAGVADPQTGYQVLVDGSREVIGGTSAVAPLWAALLARLAQSVGHRFGLIHPLLYAAAPAGGSPAAEAGSAASGTALAASSSSSGLRDITEGNNGAYSAGPGWDACTGLGVPIGSKLAELLSAVAGPASAVAAGATANAAHAKAAGPASADDPDAPDS